MQDAYFGIKRQEPYSFLASSHLVFKNSLLINSNRGNNRMPFYQLERKVIILFIFYWCRVSFLQIYYWMTINFICLNW